MKTKLFTLLVLFCFTGFTGNLKAQENQKTTATTVKQNNFQKMINARVFVKPGKEAEFISAGKVMIEKSNKEEGCLGYMLYQDPFEKTNFIFVERYKNQAAVDIHLGSAYFKEFSAKIADLVSKPMEVKIFDIAGEK